MGHGPPSQGLRDKHETDTPISPLEMLDWVSKRANEAMEEWVGDSILPQNLVTDPFKLDMSEQWSTQWAAAGA